MKELKDALKVEKLVIQKNEEVQVAFLKINKEHEKVNAKFLEFDRFFDLQFVQYFKGFELLYRWMMKHHNQVTNFAKLDFEAIDTEILANKTKEKRDEIVIEAVAIVEGDGTAIGGVTNEALMDVGRVEKVVSAP